MINYFFQKIRSPTFSLISFIVFSSMPAHGISIKCGGKFSNFVEKIESRQKGTVTAKPHVLGAWVKFCQHHSLVHGFSWSSSQSSKKLSQLLYLFLAPCLEATGIRTPMG